MSIKLAVLCAAVPFVPIAPGGQADARNGRDRRPLQLG
jgi:hypothetical protein